jgi:hypothetical protein
MHKAFGRVRSTSRSTTAASGPTASRCKPFRIQQGRRISAAEPTRPAPVPAGINRPSLVDLDLGDFDAIHRVNARVRSLSTSRRPGGSAAAARSLTCRRAWCGRHLPS